jgi:TM2 domain-containing membrane protein YozV
MTTPTATGQKSWLAALLLCLFLGGLGVHRFYVGKIGTGILQILTLGGLGIWVLIDLIMIAVGKFRDKQGQPLAR